MTGRASARAAFVIAAGFLLAAIAPAAAEPSDNEGVVVQRATKAGKPIALTKPVVTAKKFARHRGRAKLAARSRKVVPVVEKSDRRKNIEAKAEIDRAATLPALVANARAELPAGTAPLEVAAANQLNELDRALNQPAVKIDDPDRAVTPIAAIQQAVVAPAPPAVYAQASNNRPWDESTLIGKIFIAFGGMLTLASAARMLIA